MSPEVRDPLEPAPSCGPPQDLDVHTQPHKVGMLPESLSWWPKTNQTPRPLDVPTEPCPYPYEATDIKQAHQARNTWQYSF